MCWELLAKKSGVLRGVLLRKTPVFAQPVRRLSAIETDVRVLEAKKRRFLWRVFEFFFAICDMLRKNGDLCPAACGLREWYANIDLTPKARNTFLRKC